MNTVTARSKYSLVEAVQTIPYAFPISRLFPLSKTTSIFHFSSVSTTSNVMAFYSDLLFFLLFTVLPSAISQSNTAAPAPAASDCNGIFLSYLYEGGTQLKPTDPTHQPYRFESTLSIQNNGLDELKSWKVFVGFKNDEFLVSASNAILADGTSLPANVGNGTVFAGYPMTDLKTPIATAGDSTQTSVQIKLLGTQFGVPLKDVPWPSNITLANDGFVCPKTTTEGELFFFFFFSFFFLVSFLF